MYNSLKENILTLKKMFKNSADFTVREMNLKGQCSIKSAIITIEGMCGKDTLALSVINPLLDYYFDCQSPDKVFDLIKNTVLTSSEIVEFTTIDEAISFSTSGFALLVVDGCSRMLAIGAQGFSFRSVSEPESEVVQRGCREGFTEPLRINMTLSEKRAKIVADALKDKGIAPDRIVTDFKGDTVQPFRVPEENRVSVCIAE
jgi:spore germination protein KA